MRLTVERTRNNRMSDVYVLKFPKSAERFVCFLPADWEAFSPIRLGRGERVTFDFVLTQVAEVQEEEVVSGTG